MDDGLGRREKLHALAGLLWAVIALGQLAAFAHAARGGPATFLPWAEGHAPLAWAGLAIVGAAVLIWAGLSVALGGRFGRDEAMQRLRRLLALVATPFALVHGWLVWGRLTLGGADARALWVMSIDTLSRAGPAWAYAFGAAALALQLEQSARVAGEVFEFPRRERHRLWYGVFAIVVSAALLLVAYDGLAALIGGQPLIGGGG